jgi:hypothetical protein
MRFGSRPALKAFHRGARFRGDAGTASICRLIRARDAMVRLVNGRSIHPVA